MATKLDLDTFTRAYIQCALWSSNGDDGKAFGSGDGPNERESMSLSLTADDLPIETLERMIADCERFQELNAEWFDPMSIREISRAGHDFWLTRNGHGAGFWDGGWEDDIGEAMTASSEEFGEVYLYLGDDGEVYSS